ncbi:uncharacterized protein MONBRDRAFT_30799 [Monosiga brevicollis MX1]|uniref:Uncharacterized protein n=1 Tax=Monosiga brevicollis TaxID=81824 RepID=A9UPB4_MONBE|nr:uncharacterized protein MONBRDRAFT_30799 [Monosiga brevicollis MX1]EDQ92388.1 predicted protein [Monosiga brevicollis MX1]|eukprot:XP_001742150.1 hypothetical protein [Monosiga brevicollis MX1]
MADSSKPEAEQKTQAEAEEAARRAAEAEEARRAAEAEEAAWRAAEAEEARKAAEAEEARKAAEAEEARKAAEAEEARKAAKAEEARKAAEAEEARKAAEAEEARKAAKAEEARKAAEAEEARKAAEAEEEARKAAEEEHRKREERLFYHLELFPSKVKNELKKGNLQAILSQAVLNFIEQAENVRLATGSSDPTCDNEHGHTAKMATAMMLAHYERARSQGSLQNELSDAEMAIVQDLDDSMVPRAKVNLSGAANNERENQVLAGRMLKDLFELLADPQMCAVLSYAYGKAKDVEARIQKHLGIFVGRVPRWSEVYEMSVRAQLCDMIYIALEQASGTNPELRAALKSVTYESESLSASVGEFEELAGGHSKGAGDASAAAAAQTADVSLMDHLFRHFAAEVCRKIQSGFEAAQQAIQEGVLDPMNSVFPKDYPMACVAPSTAQPVPVAALDEDPFICGVRKVEAVAHDHLTNNELRQGEAIIAALLRGDFGLSAGNDTFAKRMVTCDANIAEQLGVAAAVVAYYHPRLVNLIVDNFSRHLWAKVPALLADEATETESTSTWLDELVDDLMPRLEASKQLTTPNS